MSSIIILTLIIFLLCLFFCLRQCNSKNYNDDELSAKSSAVTTELNDNRYNHQAFFLNKNTKSKQNSVYQTSPNSTSITLSPSK